MKPASKQQSDPNISNNNDFQQQLATLRSQNSRICIDKLDLERDNDRMRAQIRQLKSDSISLNIRVQQQELKETELLAQLELIRNQSNERYSTISLLKTKLHELELKNASGSRDRELLEMCQDQLRMFKASFNDSQQECQMKSQALADQQAQFSQINQFQLQIQTLTSENQTFAKINSDQAQRLSEIRLELATQIQLCQSAQEESRRSAALTQQQTAEIKSLKSRLQDIKFSNQSVELQQQQSQTDLMLGFKSELQDLKRALSVSQNFSLHNLSLNNNSRADSGSVFRLPKLSASVRMSVLPEQRTPSIQRARSRLSIAQTPSIVSLDEDVSQYQQQIRDLKSKNKQMYQQHVKIQEDNSDLKRKIEEMKREVEELKAQKLQEAQNLELASTGRENRIRNALLSHQNSSVQLDQSSYMSTLQNENQQLKNDLNSATQKIEEMTLAASLDEVKADKEQELKLFSKQVENLKNQLKESKKIEVSLQEQQQIQLQIQEETIQQLQQQNQKLKISEMDSINFAQELKQKAALRDQQSASIQKQLEEFQEANSQLSIQMQQEKQSYQSQIQVFQQKLEVAQNQQQKEIELQTGKSESCLLLEQLETYKKLISDQQKQIETLNQDKLKEIEKFNELNQEMRQQDRKSRDQIDQLVLQINEFKAQNDALYEQIQARPNNLQQLANFSLDFSNSSFLVKNPDQTEHNLPQVSIIQDDASMLLSPTANNYSNKPVQQSQFQKQNNKELEQLRRIVKNLQKLLKEDDQMNLEQKVTKLLAAGPLVTPLSANPFDQVIGQSQQERYNKLQEQSAQQQETITIMGLQIQQLNERLLLHSPLPKLKEINDSESENGTEKFQVQNQVNLESAISFSNAATSQEIVKESQLKNKNQNIADYLYQTFVTYYETTWIEPDNVLSTLTQLESDRIAILKQLKKEKAISENTAQLLVQMCNTAFNLLSNQSFVKQICVDFLIDYEDEYLKNPKFIRNFIVSKLNKALQDYIVLKLDEQFEILKSTIYQSKVITPSQKQLFLQMFYVQFQFSLHGFIVSEKQDRKQDERKVLIFPQLTLGERVVSRLQIEKKNE